MRQSECRMLQKDVGSFIVVAMCDTSCPMNRFYYVTLGLMIVGLAILCFYSPWTQRE